MEARPFQHFLLQLAKLDSNILPRETSSA